MKMKICFMAVVLGLVASTATYGANLHFNFGGVDAGNPAYDANDTPGQAVGAVAAGEVYNQVTVGQGPFPIQWSDGTMDMGLTYQGLGGNNSDCCFIWQQLNNFMTSAAANPVGIQNGPGGTNAWEWQSEVGMFVSGLPAGTYDIYVSVVAHGDSTTVDPDTGLPLWTYGMEPGQRKIVAGVDNSIDDLCFGDASLQSAIIDNQTLSSWVAGDNYAKLTVTLAAGDRLGIGVDTYPVGRDRGMISMVEIVIPEPATMALMGLGSLVMLRRRK